MTNASDFVRFVSRSGLRCSIYLVNAFEAEPPGLSINKSCIGRGWVEIEYAKEDSELEIEHEGTVSKIRVSLKRD